jgi:hypothetical protein
MLRLVIATALLVVATAARAQFFAGLGGGWDRNYLHANISNVPLSGIVSSTGWYAEIPVFYKINQYITLEAAPSFMKKNYQIQGSLYTSFEYQAYKNNYINLPVLIFLTYPLRKFNVGLGLGIFGGYWASGRITGTQYNTINPDPYFDYNQAYTFNSSVDNRWDAGWIQSAMVNYTISKKWMAFVQARYNHSWTYLQKSYMANQAGEREHTWLLGGGFITNIKRL